MIALLTLLWIRFIKDKRIVKKISYTYTQIFALKFVIYALGEIVSTIFLFNYTTCKYNTALDDFLNQISWISLLHRKKRTTTIQKFFSFIIIIFNYNENFRKRNYDEI